MKRTPKATLKIKGSFVVQGEKNEPLHSGKRSSQYYDGKNSRCEDFQLGSYLERGLFGWEGNNKKKGSFSGVFFLPFWNVLGLK